MENTQIIVLMENKCQGYTKDAIAFILTKTSVWVCISTIHVIHVSGSDIFIGDTAYSAVNIYIVRTVNHIAHSDILIGQNGL